MQVDLAVWGTSVELIEVRVVSPQTRRRLYDVVSQLKVYGEKFEQTRGTRPTLALFIPGPLSQQNAAFLAENNVALLDKTWLLREAASVGLLAEATALLGDPDEDLARLLHPPFVGELLGIPPGQNEWRLYQRLCSDILDHLFNPPLNKALRENENASRVNRRDIVMPNYATVGFWHFLRQHYRADYIVIDAKNYTGEVGKEEILQLANYLSRHGTGLFGMIVTRHGDDEAARHTRREHWLMHDKLILVLNDEDLIQMLTTQLAGEPPETLIQQKIEDFRLAV